MSGFKTVLGQAKIFLFYFNLGPCDWVSYLIIKLSQVADVLSEAVTTLFYAFSTISSLFTITTEVSALGEGLFCYDFLRSWKRLGGLSRRPLLSVY